MYVYKILYIRMSNACALSAVRVYVDRCCVFISSVRLLRLLDGVLLTSWTLSMLVY